ncbi:MAG: hypothetical protein [Bacteriophage sp.]|mgnify:FL=1|nr:MAG: hypothetical protein [Bacteriophage sp.]
MKKYYFKGTNQEIKLGDKITQIITCSNGVQFECNSFVDEATIDNLIKRDSIEAKVVVPVQKSIYRTHGKRGPMPKEPNIKVINLNNKEEFKEFLNILTNIVSGKYQ